MGMSHINLSGWDDVSKIIYMKCEVNKPSFQSVFSKFSHRVIITTKISYKQYKKIYSWCEEHLEKFYSEFSYGIYEIFDMNENDALLFFLKFNGLSLGDDDA